MRIEFTVRFDQPVDRVFPYLAEPARWHEWVPAIEERRQIDVGPAVVGTRWSSVDRIGPLRIRFTEALVELEEGRRVVFRQSSPWNSWGEYVCAPENGGTRVTVRFAGTMTGWMRLLDFIPDRLATRIFEADFENLRRLLDGRRGSA